MSARSDALFRPITVAILLAIGVAGFVGTMILGAFAPDLRSGQNGGAHAMSKSATGYSVIVALAQATGRNPRIVRDTHLFTTPDLLIATPESGATDISAAIQDRDYKPTLFVFPKWMTAQDEDHPGWARRHGLLPLSEPIGVLAPGTNFTMRREKTDGRLLTNTGLPADVTLRAPRIMQVITGIKPSEPDEDEDEDEHSEHQQVLHPLLTDGKGGIVLGRLGDEQRYILADPDLINNMGLRDADQAAAALAMLDALDQRKVNSGCPTSRHPGLEPGSRCLSPASGRSGTPGQARGDDSIGIAFDVSFNGFGRAQSPLKLLFEPPFVAMTITLAAAVLLVALNALARFGPIAPRARAIAYGKAVLVDNSAALVRKAGREAKMGARYAAVIRDRAARIFGAPARLKDAALVAYLDKLGGRTPFSTLMREAEAATDRRALLNAARALHDWQAHKTEKRS